MSRDSERAPRMFHRGDMFRALDRVSRVRTRMRRSKPRARVSRHGQQQRKQTYARGGIVDGDPIARESFSATK
jgi:hypothetical protein